MAFARSALVRGLLWVFGVKLGDVRGQSEAKDEINKVVTLWQSGERFTATLNDILP